MYIYYTKKRKKPENENIKPENVLQPIFSSDATFFLPIFGHMPITEIMFQNSLSPFVLVIYDILYYTKIQTGMTCRLQVQNGIHNIHLRYTRRSSIFKYYA